MGDDPRFAQEIYFARLLRAREVPPEQRFQRGLRGRSYELPDGRVVSPRELRKLAGRQLSTSYFPRTDVRGRFFMAIRFRAWKEGRTAVEIWEDPQFRERWQYVLRARRSRARNKMVRIARSWELLDVTEPSIDGGWDYTEEFLAWLAAGAPNG